MKLSSVATDILGVSGRAMLSALVEGTRDPEILSELARGQLRKKLPQLKEALAGRFGAHHALLVGTILSHLEFLDEAIEHLSAEIEQVIAPFEAEVELVRTIPGVARRTAESLIAEIGVDMGRFGSSARLASWAGMCPGNTGGKHRSGKTRKGSKWLRTALIESARAASRSKGTSCRLSTTGCGDDAGTAGPRSPWATRSSSPPTTSWIAASPTPISEPTISSTATTPSTMPTGSCPNS